MARTIRHNRPARRLPELEQRRRIQREAEAERQAALREVAS